MTLYEKYKEIDDKANELFWSDNCDEEVLDNLDNQSLQIRDRFTKSDWEELIAQSHGRAKYEYTRMMKEKFPEPGNPLYEGKGEEE